MIGPRFLIAGSMVLAIVLCPVAAAPAERTMPADPTGVESTATDHRPLVIVSSDFEAFGDLRVAVRPDGVLMRVWVRLRSRLASDYERALSLRAWGDLDGDGTFDPEKERMLDRLRLVTERHLTRRGLFLRGFYRFAPGKRPGARFWMRFALRYGGRAPVSGRYDYGDVRDLEIRPGGARWRTGPVSISLEGTVPSVLPSLGVRVGRLRIRENQAGALRGVFGLVSPKGTGISSLTTRKVLAGDIGLGPLRHDRHRLWWKIERPSRRAATIIVDLFLDIRAHQRRYEVYSRYGKLLVATGSSRGRVRVVAVTRPLPRVTPGKDRRVSVVLVRELAPGALSGTFTLVSPKGTGISRCLSVRVIRGDVQVGFTSICQDGSTLTLTITRRSTTRSVIALEPTLNVGLSVRGSIGMTNPQSRSSTSVATVELQGPAASKQ